MQNTEKQKLRDIYAKYRWRKPTKREYDVISDKFHSYTLRLVMLHIITLWVSLVTCLRFEISSIPAIIISLAFACVPFFATYRTFRLARAVHKGKITCFDTVLAYKSPTAKYGSGKKIYVKQEYSPENLIRFASGAEKLKTLDRIWILNCLVNGEPNLNPKYMLIFNPDIFATDNPVFIFDTQEERIKETESEDA